MRSFFLAVPCAALMVACGGDVFTNDNDAAVDSPADSPTEGSPPNQDAPDTFSCGTTSCSGDQVCVHSCCGGVQACLPLDDGGTCPSGLSISATCPSQEPCTYVCTPPPPYCGTAKDCPPTNGHDCYLLCG